MSDSGPPLGVRRALGALLLVVGVAVFAIRLQHAGPYDPPEGGNLLGGVLSLALGAWLVRDWLPGRAGAIAWAALAASPIVLFFALYATLAELEEVVVLRADDRSGRAVDLRLWIVEHDGATWVTMPRGKADAHGLGDARVQLLRDGEWSCVVAERHEDRETVNAVHHARHGKYRVQRLAAAVGLFGRDADPRTVALRIEPCPPEPPPAAVR